MPHRRPGQTLGGDLWPLPPTVHCQLPSPGTKGRGGQEGTAVSMSGLARRAGGQENGRWCDGDSREKGLCPGRE